MSYSSAARASSGSASKGYAKKPWVKPMVIKEPRVVREWSCYQQNIFEDIAKGEGNTQVDAKAGSGKTSVLVEGFYHVPNGKSILMVAFNKSIQIELEKRAPENTVIKTLHALGYNACRKAFPRLGQPDSKGEKLYGFVKAERGDSPETFEIRDSIAKAVSLCKGYLADNPTSIDDVLYRHDIDICSDTREEFIATVMRVLTSCKNDTSRVDFDDMVWLPIVHNLSLEKYDYVFIDEAQDLNKAQIELALNSVKSNGRIISVGDPNQSIYGFRGADSNAIGNIVSRLNAKMLPLSITYRCARKIVELAQTLVPQFEAAPNAIEGTVEHIPESKVEELIGPGDFFLSRTNAPLIKWCLAFLKAGIPANIQGRDLGKQLTSLIKKSKAKSVNDFLAWLEEYRAMEVEKLVKAKRDPSVIEDKVDCLIVLCEGAKELSDVKDNIDKLFYDGNDLDRVILSSTHKSKGLERDRCFILHDTYRAGKNQEESNIAYVAYTRGRKAVYLVSKFS